MKTKIYILLIILFSSCTQPKKYAEIEVTNTDIDFIEITHPIDDITLWDNKTDTVYKENSSFFFKKEITSPQFATIKINDQRLKAILLPNSKTSIAYIDSSYQFQGKNKEGQKLLNELKRPYYNVNESNKYVADTTVFQVQKKIKSQKENDIEKLKKIKTNNLIESQFSNILETEIDYFYALKTQQIILDKQYQNVPIKEEFLELFKTTLEKYPLDIAAKTDSWSEYAEITLLRKPIYDLVAKGTITNDSLQKWYNQDKLYPFQMNVIYNNKIPKITEKVAAQYMMFCAKQRNFQKSLITVYDNFKNKFPQSNYLKYLEPEINMIKHYHDKISKKIPNTVTLIDGKNINTLEQLIDTVKGEKYYVDVWATWCGPCKDEFKHNKKLSTLLKSKGYKKLYISLDREEFRDKWEAGIKYYDLEGIHLLANSKFFEDFEKNHSSFKGYVGIPQYLIINQEGKIITKNAPRPSDISVLEKVL